MGRFTALLADPPPESAQSYKRIRWVQFLNAAGRPAMKIWRGKQSRPYSHFYYASEARRDEALAREKAAEDSHEEFKQKRQVEKATGIAAMLDLVKVGTIFHYSWGYDQTNCEFWEVVAVHGQMVEVREIASEMIPSQGFAPMAGRCKPKKGCFLTESCRNCHNSMTRAGDDWVDEHGKATCEYASRSPDADGKHVVCQTFPMLRKKIQSYGISFDHGCGTPTDPDTDHYVSWYA